MVKILAEYENGQQSPYYPWLNAMPRQFFNGVAMTGMLNKKMFCSIDVFLFVFTFFVLTINEN